MSTETENRQNLVLLAQRGINHTAQVGYVQRRPMASGPFWSALWHNPGYEGSTEDDCSESITMMFKALGLADPNGRGYDGQGNTATLLAYNPHIPESEVLPGDIGIFVDSVGETKHAIMAMTAKGTEVFSHGTSACPCKVPLALEKQYHAGQTLIWVRAIPHNTSVLWRWHVMTGGQKSLGYTIHPVIWATRHPRAFRRYQSLRFNRVPR